MTILRRALALVACVTVGAFLAASVEGPASSRTVDERCAGRGPIPASALVHGVSSGCSLVGRTVYAGRVAVVVPPPGVTVAGDGYGTHGEVIGLRVTNTGTEVRATTGAHAGTSRAATATGDRRAAPAACKDRTFHLEGHHWKKSLRYGINLAKAPSQLGKATMTTQIKAANVNMRKGRNSCGRPRLATPVAHYTGKTSAKPDITPGARLIRCGDFNTKNVVGFGNLPGNLLGWTCYWWLSNKQMGAADIMIDNGTKLVTSIPSGCTDKWDFEGTLTHEFGHAYGMGHAGSAHPNLTMDHTETACSTYARTLGLGDWLGMKKMYGTR